jgi:purine-nucleoside phosphorylase
VSDAPVILKPHEPVAERVLLPGDPGRALRLAQQLIDGPRMLNHHRGLWGYSGPAADGAPLTIQSTGLGGPSAPAVVGELIGLGARRLIRVGTAAGLGATRLGALVVADAAIAADGASRALVAGGRVARAAALTAAVGADERAAANDTRTAAVGADERAAANDARTAAVGAAATDARTAAVGADERVAADEELAAALAGAVEAYDGASGAGVRGLVASADIHDPVLAARWAHAGALACDLATAAVLAAAARHGAAAASVLAITRAGGERIADDALEALEARLGAAGAAALR